MKTYRIVKSGYDGDFGEFSTLTAARKELSVMKKEAKAACRTRTRIPKVTYTANSYRIEFGCNLWSAASIITVQH